MANDVGERATEATVLVVDDEAPLRFALSEVLTELGYHILEADSVTRALPQVADADVVVTDLSMPGLTGLDLLDSIKQTNPQVPVIILTARGSERLAVSAMKQGAWDYLAKPFDNEELGLCIRRAVEHRRLRQSDARRAVQNQLGNWIIGESPVFLRLLGTVERVAQREVSVLLQGETGTGKEGIATLIHAHSPRCNGPLVRFNCAAVTETLAAAELFGHERGAFTGAVQKQEGYFRRADTGTLVLDEVSELPLSVQATLLRALQQGEVQPVGAAKVSKVDVRVIACSAAPLHERVRDGRFRADLYYRLKVIELVVPPLRERTSDIPLLARHFQLKYAERFGFSDVPLPAVLVQRLQQQAWPGNVRELENTVAQWLALSDDGHVTTEQLAELSQAVAADGGAVSGSAEEAEPMPRAGASLRERVIAFERSLIAQALIQAGNNQSQAARLLGATRTTLIDKMKRFGIP